MGTGNAVSETVNSNAPSVYPRGYGERTKHTLKALMTAGLSPWVRGTPVKLDTDNKALRFIPVGTGNAFDAGRIEKALPVYPRGYGERIKRKVFLHF